MKIKLACFTLLSVFVANLLISGIASAQDAATVFTQQTNPHAVCEWYRSNGYVVERESDNECLTSLGDGGYKAYTQYYYSGNNWCYKLIQEGQTFHENCIPIPNTTSTSSDDYTPYIVVGVVIFVVLVVAGASSTNRKSKLAKQNSDPEVVETSETATDDQKAKDPKQLKVIRSGRNGSYGWEEMETGTTDTGEDTTKGPGVGKSQGGIGLHQGEPIVSSVANDLEKLVRLKEKGIISNKEFNIAKKKLLK